MDEESEATAHVHDSIYLTGIILLDFILNHDFGM